MSEFKIDWSKLVEIVLEELNRAFEDHSCIMASTVLIEVLHAKGIKNAFPLTVKARVLNPTFSEHLKQEPFPNTSKQQAQWMADGCSIVVIGPEEGLSDQWPAHLIVVIPKALNGRDTVLDIRHYID